MNILFAASEVFPFIKTGGLADVVHALPDAMTEQGDDARVVLPAYRHAVSACDKVTELAHFDVEGASATSVDIRLLQAHKKGIKQTVYLIDIPSLYDRDGNPYADENGIAWADNAERFVVFCRAVVALLNWLADMKGKDKWTADVMHCNDWQTGLIPAFLSLQKTRPATIFTIHNLSYDGHFSHDEFVRLNLLTAWWSTDYLEFYQGFSMLKAGMVFSDAVNTVSPTYAREVCTKQYGCGFEGILSDLGDRFSGILNGIDTETWNPQTDPYIDKQYGCDKQLADNKLINKMALLKTAGLPQQDVPVMGFIGRLVEQKGVDLITAVLPQIFAETSACLVILGSGHTHYEESLLALAKAWPERIYMYVGYSEKLAHQIEAGCDIFLMPSMFEPCGLNQMYSLHYGTIPVVNNTGGLADTVVDATLDTVQKRTATGFVMQDDDATSLHTAITSALELHGNSKLWQRVQTTGMQQNFDWATSAEAYRQLYSSLYQQDEAETTG